MIEKVRLFHFRNFSDQLVELGLGTNIFQGLNGQGKSNFLESLHVVFLGQSFRPSDISHLVQQDQTEASVNVWTRTDGDQHRLNLKFQAGKRSLEIDGKKVSPAQAINYEVPILFSPESLQAIKGSVELRRALVDQITVTLNPRQLKTMALYRKALRTRNRVLKDHLKLSVGLRETQRLLESINPSFFQLGVELTLARLKLLRDLLPWINSSMNEISKDFPEIGLQYLASERNLMSLEESEIREWLTIKQAERLSAELNSGTSLWGPHRHDLVFLFGGNDSRFYASQGQQRCLILAFKLAQIVYHRKVFKRTPLVLLDDVLSELDGEKRNAFLEVVEAMEAQVIVTTTDFDLHPRWRQGSQDSADRGLRVFRVEKGRID